MHNEVWGRAEILPSFILISMGWAYNLETSVCNLSHSVEQFFLFLTNLNTVVRSIPSHKFNCDLQHNTFLGNIKMKVLWVLWASTKRKVINQLGDNTRTFRINKENKSFTYTVVFLHEQWKIDFCWIDHTRVVNIFLFWIQVWSNQKYWHIMVITYALWEFG